VQFDSLVFDLDGTLWDTCRACAIAWNNVLKNLGIQYRQIVADDVRAVTGKPHEECIRLTFHDLTPEQISKISDATMQEDNRVIDDIGGILYPGVETGLNRLSRQYRLFIVSNCQSGYIETFLRKSGLSHLFQDFECWGNTGRPKGDNLKMVIDRNRLTAPLMIGDADGDEKAALECQIPFAFVTYGFGAVHNPNYSFQTFDQLVGTMLD
jgi:phosphoglycolate phosphatase